MTPGDADPDGAPDRTPDSRSARTGSETGDHMSPRVDRGRGDRGHAGRDRADKRHTEQVTANAGWANRLSTGRRVGLVAAGGALLCLALTPPMAAVWAHAAPGETVWAAETIVERTFGPVLEGAGLLTFEGPLRPYEVYGKAFFLVYLAMVPTVRLWRPIPTEGAQYVTDRREGPSRWWGPTGRVTVGSWRAMYGSLVVAAVADFVAFWGVSAPGTVGFALWATGLAVELLALAVLLGSTFVFGLLGARTGAIGRSAGGLLCGAVLAAIPTLLIVVNYLPNGAVLPLSLAWAAIGLHLAVTGMASRWRRDDGDAERDLRSAP